MSDTSTGDTTTGSTRSTRTGRSQPAVEPDRAYALLRSTRVISRPDGSVQIGAEPPNWLILHHPPARAVDVLRALNGSASVAAVVSAHEGDVLVWLSILRALRRTGLLIASEELGSPPLGDHLLEAELSSLAQRHGTVVAGRLLRARADMLIVVRGSGRVGSAVAGLLATSGIGHVFHQPDGNPARGGDIQRPGGKAPTAPAPPTRATTWPDRARSSPAAFVPAGRPEPGPDFGSRGGPARAAPVVRGDPTAVPPRPDRSAPTGDPHRAESAGAVSAPVDARWVRRREETALSDLVRRWAPRVRTSAPAPHQHPALTVLAADAPEPPWLASTLVQRRAPHLAVRAQLTSAVVGPLVLPGRSACLLCVLRRRSELDAGWPAFEAGLRADPVLPPQALAMAAATVAVMDALTYLDGIDVPASVDGTVEWRAGDLTPRRRTWHRHADCECGAAPAGEEIK